MSVTVKKNKTANKPKKGKVKIYQKKLKPNESQIINSLQEKYNEIDLSIIKTFNDLPLTKNTLQGLKDSNYVTPTEIQLQSIGLSLQGKDILGAAKTGSGKTLAFLIPILEVLYCKQWTSLDGLGALVITPTRELAYQIYETLRKIGCKHDFSAALIIGGKDLKFERKRVDQVNIIICTPGRLLQHMDENPLFDCVNLQILVLDEADRCLDMGFAATMNAIIENLPQKRQTLLFSATQTKSVKDLARLSLKDPSYVSVHENSKYSTPDGLEQTYTICQLQDKISILWSFIRNHKSNKILVFLSSCKQVKYIYEMFCRLRPGVSLLALYGSLHQLKRMAIYEAFVSKQHVVLFATDIAARGLDFPAVNWVIQADCPEDAETYIHRVGRTARYNKGGNSSLLLLPSEKVMIEELDKKKIPIVETEINVEKLQNPIRKMESFLARDTNLKNTAQKAFVAYAKAVALMKNKEIFKVQELDTDSFAKSLGLAIPPRIRFLQRRKLAQENNSNGQNNSTTEDSKNKHLKFESDSDNGTEEEEEEDDDGETVKQRISKPTVADKKTDLNFEGSDNDSEDDDGLLKVKRRDHDIEFPTEEDQMVNIGRKSKKAVTKAAIAKKMMKKKIVANKKIVFDDKGDAVPQGTKEKLSKMAQEYENSGEGGIDIEAAKQVLREEDVFDKQRFREQVKAKHKETKRKLKEKKLAERDEFGSGESDGDEPDLSWLPDPDKVYGKTDGNDVEEFGRETNDDDNLEEIVEKKISKSKKRKLKKPVEKSKPKKKSKLEKISSSLTVNEAEELALMLLKSK